ncbi:MAG: IS1595 family transposase [Candidatus Binatia bacterium]
MMTLRELMTTFPTEETCKQFLMEHRWPAGVTCPRCGTSDHVYALATRPWHWECSNKDCRKGNAYRFSITAGTIFEDTKYPLKVWFEVLWSILNAKKGISAMQIQRQIGAKSYQTAWYMCHRLRASMNDPKFRKLMGVVEVDETFIGGKTKNRHVGKRGQGTGWQGKTPVIGAISRKGSVVAKMIENTDTETLEGFVREAVDPKVRLVVTDDAGGYRKLQDKGFRHEVVAHSQNEYVRGEAHTGHIESFWSLLKRGIMGSYHHVSKKYLPLYLAEFTFRYNNRHNEEIFETAIAGC